RSGRSPGPALSLPVYEAGWIHDRIEHGRVRGSCSWCRAVGDDRMPGCRRLWRRASGKGGVDGDVGPCAAGIATAGVAARWSIRTGQRWRRGRFRGANASPGGAAVTGPRRSEEHTSELQSRENLVCRLLLEKKKI